MADKMADKPTKPETSPTTSTDVPSTPTGGSPEEELSSWEIKELRKANMTPSQRKEQEEWFKKREELISKGIWGERVTKERRKDPPTS